MKILVVEDDHAVAQSLQLLLGSYNYAVDIAADGEVALQMMDAFEYHLVLLDVLLPQLNGIEVCRQLRKKGFRQPVLLLTGQGEIHQKAIALNVGADDYVVKPFDNEELIARIQALLRRGAAVSEPILTWNHLSLDPNTRRVAYREQLLILTPKEFAILELLLRHQEMVFSARAILDQAWSSVESPGEEAVRCHIKDIRQKLMALGAPKDLIKTIYRIGYRLNPLYAFSTPVQSDQSPNAPQIAELHAVNDELRVANEELRVALEQLQATQAELQQRNQELQTARDELEQRVVDHTAVLSQSEVFLSSIYDGAAQPIFVVEVTDTNDFHYVSFNHSAQQSTGLSLQDVQNKTPEAVFGLELGSHFRQNYERCLQANQSITYEDHFSFHDRPFWIITTLSPLRKPQGRIDRIVGTALDISDRKQADATLRESEALHRMLFNFIDEGVCLFERLPLGPDGLRDYRYLAMNPAMQVMFGIPDLSGQSIRDNFPGEVEDWYDDYDRVLETGEALRFERESEPQGMVLEMFVTRVEGESGQRLLAVMKNVTARKRQEANLAFLADISETCSRLFSMEEIVQAVGAKVGDYLQVSACSFGEIDEVGEQVIYFGRWQVAGEPSLPGRICLSEQGMKELHHRVRTGATIVSQNTQTKPVTQVAVNTSIGALSFITVPFRKNGDWKYLFSIHDQMPRTWRADEIELVQELANRLFPRLERARTEEALRHNHEMFSALVRNAPFGIYLIDAEFRLHQINKGAEAVFSNIDPLIGRDLGEVLRIIWQEPFATKAINHFRHTLASGESYYSPIIVEPQANIGNIQAYDWQIHRITLPDGNYGVVCYFYDLSAIKRTEAALHENEQLLRLAMAGAQAGSWDWVLATGQLTWSTETYRLYGCVPTAPPPTYEDWYENCLHPDDRHWVNNHIAQVIAHRQPDTQLEFRILHPQHGIRWMLSLGHLTVNEQGEPVRLSGINLDISDRKQAELALQKQIQQEYLLNDIAQEIRQSLQLNEVLSSTVERVRAFLGVDRVIIFRFRPNWQGDVITEAMGSEWTSILSTTIFDPCFRDHYIEPYRQGRVATMSNIDAAELEPCYVELLQQFQVKANLVVPILQNDHLWGLLIAHHCTAPRQWQSTEVGAVQRLATQVGIAIQQSELYQQLELELDERKQAEQKIREQAALLDIATDAIWVHDLDHHLLYWNQGAQRLYGWTAGEALGQKANELLLVDAAEIAEIMQTVLEQGKWQGEIQNVTKTGKSVIVEGRWTLVRDEAGQPKSILTVDTDITAKKSLEAQFYQAQRLESLGTLTSGIAHDLNNALTPIISIAQLLRMQPSGMGVRSQEMLQVLENSARRAANMVRQILTFTRGMGGERSPVDVALLLQEVVTVAQQTLPKFITIQATVPAQGVKQVSADATQLHQVLMNLCINARDAMPQGGNLTFSVENFTANEIFAQMNLDAHVGQYVLITVADTGTGIAPEVRDRIFEPFFTTKTPGQGTGLGLSTAMGIVRSYGGFIQVASEVSKGTQFKVYLPAIETESVSNLSEATLPQGQGELILVVDDEDYILQSTRAILEMHHYQVLTAKNGAEAIAIYTQHLQDIAVVLVDMMMPDMDGVTVIRVLQEMNPQTRAIAISGLPPQYQQRLEALGIKTLLNKPYTTENLLNSIHLQLQ